MQVSARNEIKCLDSMTVIQVAIYIIITLKGKEQKNMWMHHPKMQNNISQWITPTSTTAQATTKLSFKNFLFSSTAAYTKTMQSKDFSAKSMKEYAAVSPPSIKKQDGRQETDSFWERRLKRRELYRELEQKLNQKEKLLQLIAKRAAARDASNGGDGKEHPVSGLVSAEELLLRLC